VFLTGGVLIWRCFARRLFCSGVLADGVLEAELCSDSNVGAYNYGTTATTNNNIKQNILVHILYVSVVSVLSDKVLDSCAMAYLEISKLL